MKKARSPSLIRWSIRKSAALPSGSRESGYNPHTSHHGHSGVELIRRSPSEPTSKRNSNCNALGTAFTVGDLGTAFQIAGGSGQDSIIATGFTFSADQRNSIFATASVEKIVDSGGTYTAPPPSPGVVGLTTGNDTIVTPFSGSTVYATAATLNAGDSLTGGAGTDVLALVGSGSFGLGQLATFTGFERIRLDNATNQSASLTLGSQPIEVDATGYLIFK